MGSHTPGRAGRKSRSSTREFPRRPSRVTVTTADAAPAPTPAPVHHRRRSPPPPRTAGTNDQGPSRPRAITSRFAFSSRLRFQFSFRFQNRNETRLQFDSISLLEFVIVVLLVLVFRRLVSLLSCSVRHSSRDSSSRVEFVCYLSSFVVSRAQAPREVRRQRATVTRARSVSPPTAAHSALELKRVVSSVLTRDAIRTSSGHPTG